MNFNDINMKEFVRKYTKIYIGGKLE